MKTLIQTTSCHECGRGLLIDDDGDKYCPDCTRWACLPDDGLLVNLFACANGDFGADDEGATDVRVALRPLKCWNCDRVRDCGLEPCPHCAADCVPF